MKPIAIVNVEGITDHTIKQLVAAGYHVVTTLGDSAVTLPEETMRDKFAVAALQGMMTAWSFETKELSSKYVDHIARFAYQQADAMIKERDK